MKGCADANNMEAIRPMLNKSLRKSICAPVSCSGDLNPKVPSCSHLPGWAVLISSVIPSLSSAIVFTPLAAWVIYLHAHLPERFPIVAQEMPGTLVRDLQFALS